MADEPGQSGGATADAQCVVRNQQRPRDGCEALQTIDAGVSRTCYGFNNRHEFIRRVGQSLGISESVTVALIQRTARRGGGLSSRRSE
jgi:hypothetical protein